MRLTEGFGKRVFAATSVLVAAPAAAVVLARLSAYMVPVWREGFRHVVPADFWAIWTHVRVIGRGGPLYWPWPGAGPDVLTSSASTYPPGRMPYPPFLTPLLAPLAPMGVEVFAAMWYATLAVALVTYAALLVRIVTGRFSVLPTLAVACWLVLFPGIFETLHDGNVEPILWVLVAAAIAFPRARGAGFAAVALVKLWGIWPLAFAALRRRGALVGATVTVTLASLAAATILGPVRFLRADLDWLRYMLPAIGQGYVHPHNVSLSFAVIRIAQVFGWTYAGGPLPVLARLWLVAASVGVPVLAGWVLRRKTERMQLATIVVASVLFAPVCWMDYLPVLLLPGAVWLGELGGAHRAHRAVAEDVRLTAAAADRPVVVLAPDRAGRSWMGNGERRA